MLYVRIVSIVSLCTYEPGDMMAEAAVVARYGLMLDVNSKYLAIW